MPIVLPFKMDSNKKGYSTADISKYLAALSNQDLASQAHKQVAIVTNELAQIQKALGNQPSKLLETLKEHLGMPGRGSKAADALNHLNAFDNNFMPPVKLQQEALTKEAAALLKKYETLIDQGASLDLSQLADLRATIENFKNSKVQAYQDRTAELLEGLSSIQEEVVKSTNRPVILPDPEDQVSATAAAKVSPTADTPPSAPDGSQAPTPILK